MALITPKQSLKPLTKIIDKQMNIDKFGRLSNTFGRVDFWRIGKKKPGSWLQKLDELGIGRVDHNLELLYTVYSFLSIEP